MNNMLSQNELNVIRRFVKSTRPEQRNPSPFRYLIPAALGICGLLLFIYSVMLFLQNPTDHAAKLILLPGSISGMILIFFCLVSIKQAATAAEKSRLAKVLRKVLDSIEKTGTE